MSLTEERAWRLSGASSEMLDAHQWTPNTWSLTAISSQEILPATGCIAGRVAARYAEAVASRLLVLARLEEGWDGYGAQRLSLTSAQAMLNALLALDPYIQTAPAVSLTGEGGVLCSWQNGGTLVELIADPAGQLDLFAVDEEYRSEWEGPAASFPSLGPWLWRASTGEPTLIPV